jgi:predicted nucleic acid-binding protein
MIVVSDTTPLNYLVLIDLSHLLHELYGRVLIPEAVRDEMQRTDTPEKVRAFISNPPAWLEVHSVPAPDLTLNLGAGEREAITLAQTLRADVLLLDDGKAGRAARERGLAVTGTLAVLSNAARRGSVDLSTALSQLQQTAFRAPASLIRLLLERDREHREHGERTSE